MAPLFVTYTIGTADIGHTNSIGDHYVILENKNVVSGTNLCRRYRVSKHIYSKYCRSKSRGHLFFFYFSFISLIADGPHHYHPACGHKGSSHLSPVHALHFFYRDASSALLQLVNQWLDFTYSRSHTFRYERKNTNPTLVRIELTTSVLADVQLIIY